MITVKFNQVSEFLDELKLERERKRVVGPIRLTTLYSRDKNITSVRLLTVLATAVVDVDGCKQIIRLERFCGDLWGRGDLDNKTYENQRKIYKEIEEKAQELNLEIRAGVYEAPGLTMPG